MSDKPIEDATANNKAITPKEEKTLLFYDDTLAGARLPDGTIVVPVKWICDNLGVEWGSQYNRIQRDDVLRESGLLVSITQPENDPDSRARNKIPMLCLPLDLLPGWLFGIQPSRVREEIRPKLARYRKQCFKVLWDAFKGDILPATDQALRPDRGLSPAEQALALAEAVVTLARQQVEFERQMIEIGARVDNLDQSLEAARQVFGEMLHKMREIELRVYGPKEVVSDAQAAEIASVVAALAEQLARQDSSKVHYQAIWGELHRRFNCTSYTRVSAAKFGTVIGWLERWLESGSELPPA